MGKTRRTFLWSAVLLAGLTAAGVPLWRFARLRPVRIDTDTTIGVLQGVGVHCVPADREYGDIFADLGIDFVRMEVYPPFHRLPEPVPVGVGDDEMDAFVERYLDTPPGRLAKTQAMFGFLRANDIRTILTQFQIPYAWLERDNFWQPLRWEYLNDLVTLYGSLASVLHAHDMAFEYFEPFNEPDGNWNGHVTPRMYGRFIESLRERLDRRGLSAVKLLGPGCAFLRREGVNAQYLRSLSPRARDALYGWSTHMWDDVDFEAALPEFMVGVWRPVIDWLGTVDPLRRKPLFVTEYASEVSHINGHRYDSPHANDANTVTESFRHGIRVVSNTIIAINRGVQVPILWRLSDRNWMRSSWGMVRSRKRGGGTRPFYGAVKALFSALPDSARIIAPAWEDRFDSVHVCAVVRADTLVVAAVNHTGGEVVRRISLRHAPRIRPVSGSRFDRHGLHSQPPPRFVWLGARHTRLRIPAESVVVARYRFDSNRREK